MSAGASSALFSTAPPMQDHRARSPSMPDVLPKDKGPTHSRAFAGKPPERRVSAAGNPERDDVAGRFVPPGGIAHEIYPDPVIAILGQDTAELIPR